MVEESRYEDSGAPVINPSTLLARVIVRQIIEAGVKDVVISPGSRNAPLSMAFHQASSKGLINLHVRIDERTAAFFALGIAKASGLPVPIVPAVLQLLITILQFLKRHIPIHHYLFSPQIALHHFAKLALTRQLSKLASSEKPSVTLQMFPAASTRWSSHSHRFIQAQCTSIFNLKNHSLATRVITGSMI
jgi:hypothetical protein